MHLHNFFQTIHSALLQTFSWSNWICKVTGRLQFRKCVNVTKCHTGKIHVFWWKKLSKSSDFYYLEPGLYPSITHFVEGMNTFFQERHNHSESCITVKVTGKRQKVEIYFANEGSGLAFSSTDLWHIFSSNAGNKFGVMLRGKEPLKPELAYDIVRIHSLKIYTDWVHYRWRHGGPIAALLSFHFKGQKLKTL